MARSFTSTSMLGTTASAPVTASPLTLSAWVYPTALGTLNTAVAITNTSAVTYWMAGLDSSGHAVGLSAVSGTIRTATSTTTCSINTWNHICFVVTSSTSRSVYLNGGGVGTSTQSSAPSSLNRLSVGLTSTTTGVNPLTGRIAEVAVWNVALSASEVAALALGVPLRRVQGLAVVGHWPLFGLASPEPDMDAGTRPLTLFGTPPAANHAPVHRFTLTWPSIPVALDAQTTTLNVADVSPASVLIAGSGSGVSASPILVSNVASSGALISASGSGAATNLLTVSDVPVSGVLISASGSGAATNLLTVSDVPVAAQVVSGSAGVSSPILTVANVSTDSATISAGGSGTATTTLAVANTDQAGVTITGAPAGSAFGVLGVADVASSGQTISAFTNLITSIPVANVAASGPTISAAASGAVLGTPSVANVAASGSPISGAFSGSVLPVANVSSSGTLLTAHGTGVVLFSISTSNVQGSGATISGSGSGVSATILGVADADPVLVAPGASGTGSTATILAVADVQSSGAAISAGTGLVISLPISNVGTNAVLLTASGTNVATFSITTANSSISAAAVSGAATGVATRTTFSAGATAGAPLLTGSPSGTASTILAVADNSINAAPVGAMLIGAEFVTLSVINVPVNSVGLSVYTPTLLGITGTRFGSQLVESFTDPWAVDYRSVVSIN